MKKINILFGLSLFVLGCLTGLIATYGYYKYHKSTPIDNHNSNETVTDYQGIDVSNHQGKIDWGKVAIDKNIQFIPTKSNGTPLLDTSAVTSMQNMFDGCKNLTTIPLLDTHNVTTFYYTFISCSNLINIPLINTSSAVNTSFMFSGCSSMTSVPELDLSNVTNTSYIFYGCKALESAPAFNTSKATNMSYMYEDCTNLKRVGQIDISKATNISYMFCSCTSLEEIDLSGGTITNTNPERTFLFQYVPTNCTIYVKDQTSKTTLEGWDSTHTYTIKP